MLLHDPRFTGVRLLGQPGPLREFVRDVGSSGVVEVVDYPGGFYSPRTQLAWVLNSATRSISAPGVAFFPHYDAPLAAVPCGSVVTVHDLTHFRVPELFASWRRAAASVLLRRAVGQATRVLTGSEATRRDLVERIPACEGKVRVVPYGVSSFWHAAPGVGARSAGVDVPFLLCVGNRKPHKNLVTAVEVLARVRREHPDMRLVIVGAVYHGWEAVLHRARALGVASAIVDLGSVDDAELRTLYARCEALLFPSLYEGFGLPVLEAMACGAPVVSSNRASLPEVIGDAGVLIDPLDATTMADAVLRLRRDRSLRESLIVRGRERASNFTWSDTGRRTVDTLWEVAGARQRLHSSPPTNARPRLASLTRP